MSVQVPPQQVSPAPAVIVQNSGPGLFIRVIYFLFIGWWLGAIASTVAWILNVTIIGLPLGLAIINHLAGIMTLRPHSQQVSMQGNIAIVAGAKQIAFIWRAIYFIFIGVWFSGIWMLLAYLALITVVLIPAAFWMYDRVAAITTLRRN